MLWLYLSAASPVVPRHTAPSHSASVTADGSFVDHITVTGRAPSHALRFVEEVLDNTLANIIAEADAFEFDVTARTRIIIAGPDAVSSA